MKNTFRMFLTLTVKDKNGKIVSKKTRKSRSFVIQFLQGLETMMTQSATVSQTDTGGTPRTPATHATNLSCLAGVGAATWGIQVGTGTTAPTNTDNAVETQIAHGAGAGQLNYGAVAAVSAGVVGANVDLLFSRTFSNASGGTISPTEATLVWITTGPYIFLIIRDTFSAVQVLNGQTLTVTYTLRTTV